MKDRYILVVVFAVICTVWNEAESQYCNNREGMVRCLFPLLAIAADIGDDFTYTKEMLERVCPDMIRAFRCVESYTARCITEEERNIHLRLLDGQIGYVKKLCVPGPFQEEFLTHQPCLMQVRDDLEHCVQKFRPKEEELRAKKKLKLSDELSPEDYSEIRTVCCLFRDFLSCYSRRVMVKCGEQAAKFTEDNVNQMFSSLMPEGCDSSEQCEGSSASRNSPLAVLVPVSLAMILPYALHLT